VWFLCGRRRDKEAKAHRHKAENEAGCDMTLPLKLSASALSR
jgi:hypothetical protein